MGQRHGTLSFQAQAFGTREKKPVYARTLSVRRPVLVMWEIAKNCGPFVAPPRENKAIKRDAAMPDLNDPQNSTQYRVRIKEGHNAAGFLVGAAGKRCIPSTQFWLTVDSCAAYRFPRSAALRVQVRLGRMGFITTLEEIRD